MSLLDRSILRDLSIAPAVGPIELPLYARFRPESRVVGGVLRTRSVPRDVSERELFAVLLQLTDFRQFRRYHNMKIIKCINC